MNYRQKILDTIKGKPMNHVPYVPRLDLWYKSNKYRNNKKKGMSLSSIS